MPTPRFPRPSVMLKAMIARKHIDGETSHRVRDISKGGMRIDNAERFALGESVFASVGDLVSVEAKIIWVEGGRAGLAFCQPIKPELGLKKAAIPTIVEASSPDSIAPAAPTAGWFSDLRNPYRR